MKNLIFVGGTMGVGKTATCQALKKMLPACAFLDGDWCWDMHPFNVNDETKALVLDNITHILNSFIHCSAFENILFCWVMHDQSIIDGLLASLDTTECKVTTVSLVCSEDQLRKRLILDVEKGIREPDVIARSIARLPRYKLVNTEKIDVSFITAEETAVLIKEKYIIKEC